MKRIGLVLVIVLLAAALLPTTAWAQTARAATGAGDLRLNIDGVGTVSAPLQIVIVLTLLAFLPAALVVMTSFTRIVIVFHFLRQALGTQEVPSNQILIGLTLFLTAFVMAPVAESGSAESATVPRTVRAVAVRRRSSAPSTASFIMPPPSGEPGSSGTKPRRRTTPPRR